MDSGGLFMGVADDITFKWALDDDVTFRMGLNDDVTGTRAQPFIYTTDL